MKKLKIIVFSLILVLCFISISYSQVTLYRKTLRTGGTSAALDGINGNSLNDGHIGFVYETGGIFFHYVLDADLGESEDNPRYIVPDTNPGSKVWVLVTHGYMDGRKICIEDPNNASNYFCIDYVNGATSFDYIDPNGTETDVIDIDSSGNVGIGTSSPTSPNSFEKILHLKGTSHTTLVLEEGDTSSSWEIVTTGDDLRFYDGANERMEINSSGYVGIGTTSPAKKLEITDTGRQIRFGYDDANYSEIWADDSGNCNIEAVSDNVYFGNDHYLNLSSSHSSYDTGIYFREAGSLRYSLWLYGSADYNDLTLQSDADEDGTIDTTVFTAKEDGKFELTNPVAISSNNSAEDNIGLLVGRVGSSLDGVIKLQADELDNGEIIFTEDNEVGDRFLIQFDSYTGYSPNSAGIKFYSDNEDALADTNYQLGVWSTNGRLGIGNLTFDTTFPATKLHLYEWDADSNGVYDAVYIDHNCTTPTDGIGSGIVLRAMDESKNMDEAGRIQGLHTDATHATQASRVDITAGGAAAGAGVSILSSGSFGVGTTTPDEKLEIEWDTNVDVEIGRGTTDTDMSFITLRDPNGTKYYVYVSGGSLTASTSKP